MTRTLASSPILVPRGIVFNGNTSYMTFAVNATNGITGNYTTWSLIVSFMCYGKNAAGGGQALVNIGLSYSGGKGLEPQINANRQIEIYGTTASNKVVSTSVISYLQPQTLGVTYDGTTMRLYINGTLDATTSTSVTNIAPLTTGFIGNESNVLLNGRAFNGAIYDIQAFGGRVLTGTEMTNYTSGTMPSTTSQVLAYSFSENSGTTTADVSGNSATATMGGSPLPLWGRGIASRTLAGVRTTT